MAINFQQNKEQQQQIKTKCWTSCRKIYIKKHTKRRREAEEKRTIEKKINWQWCDNWLFWANLKEKKLRFVKCFLFICSLLFWMIFFCKSFLSHYTRDFRSIIFITFFYEKQNSKIYLINNFHIPIPKLHFLAVITMMHLHTIPQIRISGYFFLFSLSSAKPITW